VLLTGNDDAYLLALELAENGIEVAALVDMRSGADDRALAEAVRNRGIVVHLDSTVYEALPTPGMRHIRAADVRGITGRGKVDHDQQLIECDLLCMSAGYMPAYHLPCQAGARLSYDDARARFDIDNLPAHLQIAGSVNGIHALAEVIDDGRYAGLQALANLGLGQPPGPRADCSKPVNYAWPIFPHPRGKDFVDYDEDLQVADIVNAARLGYRDVQLVKRFSTVGMGPSQGRHAALPTARLVAQATGRSVAETGVTTARFEPDQVHPYAPPPPGSRRQDDAGGYLAASRLLRFGHRARDLHTAGITDRAPGCRHHRYQHPGRYRVVRSRCG
jgi:sarcosine oxidase subunit alpha